MQLAMDFTFDGEEKQLSFEDYEDQIAIETIWNRVKSICKGDLSNLESVVEEVNFLHKSTNTYYLDRFKNLIAVNKDYVVNYIKNYLK